MATPVTAGKRELRSLELKAFGSVVDAFRAQGALTERKQEVLNSLAVALNVDEERGRCEMRRAANDDHLTSIAGIINGHETEYAWRRVSTQRIPFVPMRPDEGAYLYLADQIARVMSHCKNFAPDARADNTLRARTRTNVEELAERKMLDSYLADYSSDEEAISLEAKKIEQCSYNQFTKPEKYMSMIRGVENDEANAEWSGRRLSMRESFPQKRAAGRSSINETRAKNVHKSLLASHLNSLIEEDARKGKEVPAVRAPESQFRLPSAQSTKGRVGIKGRRVKPSTSERSQRSRTADKSIPAVISEEPTRMVRQAKLNAKRWNPKTKTLESPTNKPVESDVAPTKTSASARGRPLQHSVRRKVVPAENDDVEKAASSKKKRIRRPPRLTYGKRRRRVKPVNEVDPSVETGAGISNMDSLQLKRSVSEVEESSKKARMTVTGTDAVNDRSHSPAFDLDLSDQKEWLQKLESEPRRINILRKRVFVGGSQVESAKKFCEQSQSVEMLKNNPPADRDRDSISIVGVVKSEAGNSVTKCASVEQPKETTSSEPAKLVLDTSTVDDSSEKTKTNRDSVADSEVVTSSEVVNDTQKETCSETEIVPNSSSNAHEGEDNCDYTRSSEGSISSPSIIPVEKEAKSKLPTDEPENTKSSDQVAEAGLSALKRVKISIPGSGNTMSQITLGIPIVSGAEQRKGIKTLPPSCDKIISERLLGNRSVRVRSGKSLPDHLEATLASAPCDVETTEMSTSPIDSPRAELSDDNPSDVNSAPEEVVLSASEDETSSDSAIASNNTGSEGSSDHNVGTNSLPTITLDEGGSSGTANAENDDITDAISVVDEEWSDADSALPDGTYSFEESIGKKVSAR